MWILSSNKNNCQIIYNDILIMFIILGSPVVTSAFPRQNISLKKIVLYYQGHCALLNDCPNVVNLALYKGGGGGGGRGQDIHTFYLHKKLMGIVSENGILP
jgi:hypothetical protein